MVGASDLTETKPRVELTKAFTSPFKNVVATARTCYSGKGIIDDEVIDLAPGGRDDSIARSIYQAGHHTTYQHAQFQFAISNVSRHFVWSFLHSHPFYNSEQVSQRYVRLKKDSFYLPPLADKAREIYLLAIESQMEAYHQLRDRLVPVAEAEFHRIFPGRKGAGDKYRSTILKKTQEAARYVAPVAALTYLYHTVSGITLLRYWKMCQSADVPHEQRRVVELMVAAVLRHDPGYQRVLEEPLDPTEFAEFKYITGSPRDDGFADEFDEALNGRAALLVDWKNNAEPVLADSVREVLGRSRAAMTDDDALALALDPQRNQLFGETMNLSTHSKLTRTLYHPSYTFRKKLSHTADSQDQRHRMTPASRPILAAQLSGEPDFITPALIAADEECLAAYTGAMARTWESIRQLMKAGVADEFANYLLPNAVAVRFTESADLLNLLHKHRMRLCYNAQEEIWRASVDEAREVSRVHPRIGAHLLPPCTQRLQAGTRPICPEGDRYCGIPVWKLELDQYERLL
ncbi:MAG: FAD-dependent thymidylate synthase [Candidatus Marinimicrobia bacterium]|nr:FAD-dependent thymidylate synthase [Candidatus Neomarinimicrobiota bacterium]